MLFELNNLDLLGQQRTKINAAIKAANRLANTKLIILNGDAADAGEVNVFKTPQEVETYLNDVANNVVGNDFIVKVFPGQYAGADIVLPDKANVNFCGVIPGMCSFGFKVSHTPDATAQVQSLHKEVAFQEFEIDYSAIPGGGLEFVNGAVKLTRLDNNANVIVGIFGSGIIGGDVQGKLFLEACILIDTLNVATGSEVYCTGLILVIPGKYISLTGTATLRTFSTVDRNLVGAYVEGLTDSINFPKWYTDEASDIDYVGTLDSIKVEGFQEINVDITGLGGVLDLQGKSGFSIINLTNGDAVPELNQILNYPSNRNFYIRPTADIKVNDQSQGAGYNLRLTNPFLNILGSANGFIEFSFRQGPGGPVYHQLSFVDQYN